MRYRRKSRLRPLHARKGNSLWARIDNFEKNFVIARAHFGEGVFFDIYVSLLGESITALPRLL